jgi:hypothetical protein
MKAHIKFIKKAPLNFFISKIKIVLIDFNYQNFICKFEIFLKIR